MVSVILQFSKHDLMSNFVHHAVMNCSPPYHEIEVGNSLHLWCDSSGVPHANIHWLHNGTLLADEYQGVKITGPGDAGKHSAVKVANVSHSNGGTYTFRVVSDTGSTDKNFTVRIISEFQLYNTD